MLLGTPYERLRPPNWAHSAGAGLSLELGYPYAGAKLAKEYGTQKRVEGDSRGEEVALVEDIRDGGRRPHPGGGRAPGEGLVVGTFLVVDREEVGAAGPRPPD